eukprot:gene3334-2316_t
MRCTDVGIQCSHVVGLRLLEGCCFTVKFVFASCMLKFVREIKLNLLALDGLCLDMSCLRMLMLAWAFSRGWGVVFQINQVLLTSTNMEFGDMIAALSFLIVIGYFFGVMGMFAHILLARAALSGVYNADTALSVILLLNCGYELTGITIGGLSWLALCLTCMVGAGVEVLTYRFMLGVVGFDCAELDKHAHLYLMLYLVVFDVVRLIYFDFPALALYFMFFSDMLFELRILGLLFVQTFIFHFSWYFLFAVFYFEGSLFRYGKVEVLLLFVQGFKFLCVIHCYRLGQLAVGLYASSHLDLWVLLPNFGDGYFADTVLADFLTVVFGCGTVGVRFGGCCVFWLACVCCSFDTMQCVPEFGFRIKPQWFVTVFV